MVYLVFLYKKCEIKILENTRRSDFKILKSTFWLKLSFFYFQNTLSRSKINEMSGSQKFSQNFHRKVLSNLLRLSDVCLKMSD